MSGYGPTGPQGVQGIQGVKGDQGLQGPTGLQGIAGPGGGGGASLTSTSNIVITAPSGVGINVTPAYTLDLNGGSLGNVGTLNVSKASSSGIPVVVNNATAGVDYTITTSGSKTFYNFKAVRAAGATQMSITTTSDLVVDYLALGGGGGGNRGYSGGGGAGGLQQATGFSLTPATRTITIGNGGNGGIDGQIIVAPTNGFNTTFGAITTALGGGAGGTYISNGANGGCGGGAGGGAANTGGVGSQGGSGAPGGGSANGGGGGVAASGGTATTINGGTGITYNNGSALQLGGGGGGGAWFGSGTFGVGTFGGGNGGSNASKNGVAGLPNTGGGGGGGSTSDGATSSNGGAGGSGIFILAFNTADIDPGAPITFASASIDASYNLLLSATSNIRLTASNVGINQAQPAYTLDVSGTGQFTSNLLVNSNVGIGTLTPAYTLDLNGGSLGNVGTLNVSKASSGVPVIVTNATEGTDYTITTSGSKTFYNFKAVRAAGATQMSITTAKTLVVDYFAIGGGGAGGGMDGGGGGAGGLQTGSMTLTVGSYPVTIGTGGIGTKLFATGDNGTDTTFQNIVAEGGGGGGCGHSQPRIGGCGGGAGYSPNSTTNAGAEGTQGFYGGSAAYYETNNYTSAGGGGTSSVGQSALNSTSFGVGGSGTAYNNVLYGAGGGGMKNGTVAVGGGLGAGNGGFGSPAVTPATSALPNTGSGGGGGIYTYFSNQKGGNGGSGIFILAFNTVDIAPGGPLTFASASIDASYNLLLSATSNIRLTATNVGINVTQPTVALDVAGQIRGRVVLSNWAGPTGAVDFTSSTGNSIYNYITNTGFNALTLGNPGSGYVGSYSVIKNNTTTGLSIALTYATGATGPASPLILYSSNAATLIWSGMTNGYIQF